MDARTHDLHWSMTTASNLETRWRCREYPRLQLVSQHAQRAPRPGATVEELMASASGAHFLVDGLRVGTHRLSEAIGLMSRPPVLTPMEQEALNCICRDGWIELAMVRAKCPGRIDLLISLADKGCIDESGDITDMGLDLCAQYETE